MQEQAGVTRKLPRSGLVQPWVIVTYVHQEFDVLLNLYFLCSFPLQEEPPIPLNLFSFLLDPFLPPAGLAERDKGREKI
jgi:hypothetical protein